MIFLPLFEAVGRGWARGKIGENATVDFYARHDAAQLYVSNRFTFPFLPSELICMAVELAHNGAYE